MSLGESERLLVDLKRLQPAARRREEEEDRHPLLSRIYHLSSIIVTGLSSMS